MARVSVSALAETLVRVQVGHLVSSSSMVSRAYLVDDCVGVVVDQDGFWLHSPKINSDIPEMMINF